MLVLGSNLSVLSRSERDRGKSKGNNPNVTLSLQHGHFSVHQYSITYYAVFHQTSPFGNTLQWQWEATTPRPHPPPRWKIPAAAGFPMRKEPSEARAKAPHAAESGSLPWWDHPRQRRTGGGCQEKTYVWCAGEVKAQTFRVSTWSHEGCARGYRELDMNLAVSAAAFFPLESERPLSVCSPPIVGQSCAGLTINAPAQGHGLRCRAATLGTSGTAFTLSLSLIYGNTRCWFSTKKTITGPSICHTS